MTSELTRKIKICVVLPTHWAARMGGAQYQAMILVDYLVATGRFEIYYLARRTNETFNPDGYRVIRIPGPANVRPYRFFESTFSLLAILREIRPDFIYQQTGCAYTGICAYYAKKNNCRMIWRVSSDRNVQRLYPNISRNLVYESIDSAMMSYGIRHADRIIVQTNHQADLLEKNYRRSADAVISNFHPCPDREFEKQTPVKVLWIANFKKLKQPEVFVRLAQDMSDIHGIEFIMVGAPALGARWFNRLADEISSTGNIEYTGSLSQQEVNSLLCESHILVNTSQYEGFSNTFIQAWMRRVPVLSLNVNPDKILDSFGIGFCAEGDYTSLLQYTRMMVSNHALLRTMGDRAREYALENYSLKNIEKIVNMLDQQRAFT